MGTWGDGLYDNDSALDLLGDMMDHIPLDESPAYLVVGIGLRIWLGGDQMEYFTETLEAHPDWLAERPKAAQVLDELSGRESLDGDRPARYRQIMGNYCSGPRVAALVEAEGADAVIATLVKPCREYLNEMAAQEDLDLYEAASEFAPLGILLELDKLRPAIPAQEIDAWERAFERANEITTEERGFWDGFVGRVRPAFGLLREACDPEPW